MAQVTIGGVVFETADFTADFKVGEVIGIQLADGTTLRVPRYLAVHIAGQMAAAGIQADVAAAAAHVAATAADVVATTANAIQATAARDVARAWAEAVPGADVTPAGGRSALHYAGAAAAQADRARAEAERAERAGDLVDGATVPDPTPAAAGMVPVSTGDGYVMTPRLPALIRADTLAIRGTAYRVDTSAGPVRLALPEAPAPGDAIRVIDACGGFAEQPCHLVGPVLGDPTGLELDVAGLMIDVWFDGATWRVG